MHFCTTSTKQKPPNRVVFVLPLFPYCAGTHRQPARRRRVQVRAFAVLLAKCPCLTGKQTRNESRLRLEVSLSSSPAGGAKKYTLERVCIFLSKPQAWHIITARSAVYITNNGRAVVVSHHAPACIFLWLDDIQCFALMIYTPSA